MRERVFPFFITNFAFYLLSFNDYRKENDQVKSQISNLSVFSVESV